VICGSLLSGLGRAVSGKAGYDCELPGQGSDKDCIGIVRSRAVLHGLVQLRQCRV
jgi:hypothetical protein